MRIGVTSFVFFLSSIVWGAGFAQEAAFVAAFDRLGRHGDADIATSGRLLLTELNCTACHQVGGENLTPKGAPDLSAAGSRMSPQWMIQFLRQPRQSHSGTTMPDVLASLPADKRELAAKALAAFLGSQRKPFLEIKATGANPVPAEFWNHGDAKRGQVLYHRIGCVACHDPDEQHDVAKVKPSPLDQMLKDLDAEEIEDMGLAAAARRVTSVAHPDLSEKYSRKSLTHFLLNPASVRPGGRMPDFTLKAVEAADVAAYLMTRYGSRLPPSDHPGFSATGSEAALVARGRELFAELRCDSCHNVNGFESPGKAQKVPALTPAKIEKRAGCIGTAGRGYPHYILDDAQAQAIQATIQTSVKGEKSVSMSAQQRLDLTMMQLNCFACHQRDRIGGVGRFRKPYFETVGHVDIGDEGRLPPPLTGVGSKLKPAWINNVLDGKGAVRRHMHARMPRFRNTEARELPKLLAAAALPEPQPTETAVFGNTRGPAGDALADSGRALMDIGCVQCHAFRGESLPGTVGLDLEGVTARLHPQWFHDFLLNPVSLKERTRMPSFFPGGKSQNPNILSGDPEKQIAAMWAYLRELPRQPLPEKIVLERSKNYELRPESTAVVLRTFMKHAGPSAIAVGLPGEINFAFDAEQIRLAEVWRGRFLDAEGTWFVRSAPPALPLGQSIARFPPGPFAAAIDDSSSPWPTSAEKAQCRFRGYRLDDHGVPVFLYDVDGVRIEDEISPGDDVSLNRSITLRGKPNDSPKSVWIRVLVGTTIEAVSPLQKRNENGLTVSSLESAGTETVVRESAGHKEWLIRLPKQQESTVVLNYRWKGESNQ